jgi:type II secretory pathway pseudopilin PulG
MAVVSTAMLTFINPIAQFKKARDSQRESDLALLSTAIEQYYSDNNKYPADTGTGASIGIGCLERALTQGDTECDGSTTGETYIRTFPNDPQSNDGASYCYQALNSRQDYVLCARYEFRDEKVALSSCGPTGAGSGSGDYCIANQF